MRLDAAQISPSRNKNPSTGSTVGVRLGSHARSESRLGAAGQQGHALFERARDEENIPHMRVEVAHEFLDAPARRAVMVAEAARNGGLQIFPQRVQRAVGVIMQFRPRAQQEIIGGFKLLAFGFADEFLLLQFAERARCGI